MNRRVPAPGLEPGQTRSKAWWAANYPTPDHRRSELSVGRWLHDTEQRSLLPAARTLAAQAFRCQPGLQLWVVFITAVVHGGAGPSFDPPVQIGALPDTDPETPVVVIAQVLADSLRIVALER